METEKLNKAIIQILEKRTELSALAYSDESYDEVEEALHDMEDDFTDEYGDYLEKILKKVHQQFCSDSEVLLAVSYLPKKVKIVDEEFEISAIEGVIVELDDDKTPEGRIILLPNPPQILLTTSKKTETVWSIEG